MRPESFQTGGEKSKKKLKNAEKGIWGLENNLRVAIETNGKELESIEGKIQKLEEELKALKEKHNQLEKERKELEEKAKGITGREKELSQRDGEKKPSQRDGEKELSQKDKDRDKETSEVKPEELKFKVIEGYFEGETREGIKNKDILTISSFDKFVFAGRDYGCFTLYQPNPEKGIMEVVKVKGQEKLLPDDISGSAMNKDYLAVSGCSHHLKIYFKKSKNPNNWFEEVRDLSNRFDQPVSGLDLDQGLVGAVSRIDSKILVYDLKNGGEILIREFPEVGSIYTFKFISNTDYAVITGTHGIIIINYRQDGQVKWAWEEPGLSIGKTVSLFSSLDKREIAFTKCGESGEIYFLDISDLDNLDPNQEPEKKQVLNEYGNPTKLLDNWCLSYAPDGKYLVIGSDVRNILTIIDRDSMEIVKQYGFGREANAIDSKGNIIATDESGKQLVYVKRGSK